MIIILISAIVSLINLIIKSLGFVASGLVSFLPSSPFLNLTGFVIPYVNSLNWVLPVQFMLTVITLWTGSIALYYIVQVVLRWVKMIQ